MRNGKTLRQRVEALGHTKSDWDENIHDVLDKLEWQGTMTTTYMAEQVKWVRERAQLEKERDNWAETARRESINAQYYRGIVERIGKLLGPEVYTQDDGGVVPDVLVAKVEEVAKKRLT